MILKAARDKVHDIACPHTRGDDPPTLEEEKAFADLSPYAWG